MGRAYQNRKESMAKTSDQKAKVYSKYSKEIYMCAKNGGAETSGNLALAGLIERAKKDQVPAHVIDKALDKAQGGGGEDFSVARYEGYGPGSSMVIVDCLTDNPNRTFGDLRGVFNKANAKLGTQGSVAHMFDHSAIFVFDGEDEEAVLEALLMDDVDVNDVEAEDGKITVFAPNTEYNKVKQALLANFEGIEFDVDEIQFIPNMSKQLEGEDLELFEKFIAALEDVDDVQNVYFDVEL
ncbi:YebC/PmpR family DNA-binding transcriptional regulator [Thiomicrorhabdus sp. 6S2-11]|jgi:YebC/PmpR family DNA-binding regulatory protein|uniref:Probable transcriptional regulatory protein J3998_04695 n=1 Tax=Thiomicrorhabdus marina TaxID=2818442 RepID=A0ABS3Q3M1_9GAMM|nr:YebC/PmpR family DNA-binding transcriptional regulator [Thiomicrorhabdus marina]MBO1926866.1 YebC/PmpR family DNA-binding transcriptional regulator [Thiomicrorhabdus marina]